MIRDWWHRRKRRQSAIVINYALGIDLTPEEIEEALVLAAPHLARCGISTAEAASRLAAIGRIPDMAPEWGR